MIINFGSINIDKFYDVDEIVVPGQTIKANSHHDDLGGKGFNQSTAISKAGFDVRHVGIINKEDQWILKKFKEFDLSTDDLVLSDVPTGTAFIQVDSNGENSIVIDPGSNNEFTEAMVDRIFNKYKEKCTVLVQNETNCVDYILKKAKEFGHQTVINFAPYQGSNASINLNYVDYLVVNEEELSAITKETDLDKSKNILLNQYPHLGVINTLGSKGSIYFSKDRSIEAKAHAVEAVDTTSAGDTYTGYLTAYLSQGKDIDDAMKLASIAGALATTKKGTSSSIPYIEEVKMIFNEG